MKRLYDRKSKSYTMLIENMRPGTQIPLLSKTLDTMEKIS